MLFASGIKELDIFNILLLDTLTPWWNGGQKRVKRKKAQSWNRKRRKSVRAKMTDCDAEFIVSYW